MFVFVACLCACFAVGICLCVCFVVGICLNVFVFENDGFCLDVFYIALFIFFINTEMLCRFIIFIVFIYMSIKPHLMKFTSQVSISRNL